MGPLAALVLLVPLIVACATDSDNDGVFDEDDLQVRSCADEGGFVAVEVSGAINAQVASSDDLICGGGSGQDSIRGVLFLFEQDGRDWQIQALGELDLGATVNDALVEVFVFSTEANGTNDSWFGDCRADINTFEFESGDDNNDGTLDEDEWHRYRFGASIRCEAPLEPFIGPEASLTLANFNLVGFHLEIPEL